MRPIGESYLPPFPISNINYCQGIASDVTDGKDDMQRAIVVTMGRLRDVEDEYEGDTVQFAVNDWRKFTVYGELLTDQDYTETILRDQMYKRRMCQEINPSTGEHYYEPFEYLEL